MSLSNVLSAILLASVSQTGNGQSTPVPRLGFLGLHGGVFAQIEGQAAGARVEVVALDGVLFSAAPLDLTAYDALFIQHLKVDDSERLALALSAAKKTNPDLHVFSISGIFDHLLPEWSAAGELQRDLQLEQYYRAAGAENMGRLLRYVSITYLGGAGDIQAPLEAQSGLLFHPEHAGPFSDVPEFQAWSREHAPAGPDAPLVAIAVHRIHRIVQQPRVLEALTRALAQRGLAVVAVEDNSPLYAETIRQLDVQLILHLCHSFDTLALREQLDVPHLHSIFFRQDSIEQWEASAVGLDARTMAFQIASQELLGAIEPQVGAGTPNGQGSTEAFEPIPERIAHLADRARAWVRLRQLPNADKKVAIIYYNREMGKADLMRGSATGMFMNAPRSLMAVLKRMAQAGYSMAKAPIDEDQLLRRMVEHGQQIGAWAPKELERVARSGKAVLIPVPTYKAWLDAKVPSARRQELLQHWGPAPGRIQVWRNAAGEEFLVLPRVELGDGVILLPQPLRGEAHDTSLAHDLRVPPSHNYLATYFWLQEEFQADALVHFGTHGTEFLLPGKATGLAGDDWPDLILGKVPNITPWVVNNLGESAPARRRSYAVLINHLVPPSVNAGLSDGLLRLHDDIDKWETLPEGTLEHKFRVSITEQVLAQHLDRDLRLHDLASRTLSPDELQRISAYLHEISNDTTPVSLHTFGEPLAQELLIPYLVTCLRSPFMDALGQVIPVPAHEDRFGGDRRKYLRARAEEALEFVLRRDLTPEEAIVACGGAVPAEGLSKTLRESFELARSLAAGLAATGQEIDNFVRALDGGFIPPGPGNSPDRNAGVLPTGRNMYTVNPEEIPSRPSWEVGKGLVDGLLATQLQSRGRYPKKVGFTLNSFATFQDYGVMESQIFYLCGVRPVWDSRNMVTKVELIPREELGRPRIDVFLASGSYYRDMLPTRMHLIDQAIQLAASLDEEDNWVFSNSQRVRQELAELGFNAADAEKLSRARLFGYPPGQSGSAGYYYLVERSGEWDTNEDLMQTYLDHVRFVYTEGMWGARAAQVYDRQIQDTEVILRSWSDRTRSPLSNKYDWFKAGSLSRAVEYLTGKEPEFFFSDVRDPDSARMVLAEEALRQDFRVRLFNRKWLEGMMKEGYAGADQLAKHVSNTMGWAIMREHAVEDDIWEEIVRTLVDDRLNLGLREWFEEENPFAFQELTEILLESIRKGYWDASPEMRSKLAELYAASVAKHGEGGGMLGGANHKLDSFVSDLLAAPGSALNVPQASAAPAGLADEALPNTAPTPTDLTEIRGRELEPVQRSEPLDQPAAKASRTQLFAGLGALFLLVAGFATRRGIPRA